jgi:hypothetical protein
MTASSLSSALLSLPPRSGGEGSRVGGGAANAAVSEFTDRPPTPDPSERASLVSTPPRADARGGRGEESADSSLGDARWQHPLSSSSLRTQGPTPRPIVKRCCWTTFAQHNVLWLWVPACAGTTMWRHMRSHSRDAIRPSFAKNFPPSLQRAQGMPGARCARRRVCELVVKKHTHQSGHTGITRHSPRNGLRLTSCSPR